MFLQALKIYLTKKKGTWLVSLLSSWSPAQIRTADMMFEAKDLITVRLQDQKSKQIITVKRGFPVQVVSDSDVWVKDRGAGGRGAQDF